ncbi:MAG: AAA family ATPase, partial [Candidatus Omnitrophica bacterium]|nr:AAA family ATPase [Candidatus Omnitrophota bacterium]
MYLKKLELVGFKSFCQKTVLHFEPGITVIVGPNGCGKSNIFDAIRWVLGEQSTKSLRASDMQDVIFSGTDKREPLSMAEVSITFDNKDRFFNIDTEEVVITRRLFRSGESEYLLNKANVRLKDILDYLAGTGIGAESYSLVQQGKIDLILSVHPEDRRLVFDEAGGITKYKSQKKETQRKLEETENNLTRLSDIISEVKRQISSLEKQASRARKYKEIFEELKNKEIILAKNNIRTILKEKEELTSLINQTEQEVQALSSYIRNDEEELIRNQKELQEIQLIIKETEVKITEIKNLLFSYKQNIEFNLERIEELDRQR